MCPYLSVIDHISCRDRATSISTTVLSYLLDVEEFLEWMGLSFHLEKAMSFYGLEVFAPEP